MLLFMLTSTETVLLFQGVSETNSGMGVIPANTQLQTALSVRPATEAQKAHVELSISTPNGRVFLALKLRISSMARTE